MSLIKRFDDRMKLTQPILSNIARIDEFKGLWQGSLRLSPQILGRLKRWVIITSTGASTRIEGSEMTDQEIARFLRGLKVKAPVNRDEQEVAGYADLIGRVFDNYRTMKLSEGWILQCHSILLQFSDKDRGHLGKYKKSDNKVVMENKRGERVELFAPTPPYLVKPEMDAVLAWTKEQLTSGDIHPLLVTASFIFEFLAIHPFTDGNGRLSRALTNLLLLKAGYSYMPYVSLDEIIEETKDDYYLALRATQKNHKTDHEEITPWVNYLLKALLEQVERAKKVMAEDQPEKLLSAKQQQVWELFASSDVLSVSEIVSALKEEIPKTTVKQALARLVTLKLLERIGRARSSRYRKIETGRGHEIHQEVKRN